MMDSTFKTINETLSKSLIKNNGNGHLNINVRFHNKHIVDYQIETVREPGSFSEETKRYDCLSVKKKSFLDLVVEQDCPEFGAIYFELQYLNQELIWYKVKNSFRFNVREKEACKDEKTDFYAH
jgi:hypothetical protein